MSDQPMHGPQWLQHWPAEYETQRQVDAEQPASVEEEPPEDEAGRDLQSGTAERG